MNYHLMFNHSENLFEPDTGAHTKQMELMRVVANVITVKSVVQGEPFLPL